MPIESYGNQTRGGAGKVRCRLNKHKEFEHRTAEHSFRGKSLAIALGGRPENFSGDLATLPDGALVDIKAVIETREV